MRILFIIIIIGSFYVHGPNSYSQEPSLEDTKKWVQTNFQNFIGHELSQYPNGYRIAYEHRMKGVYIKNENKCEIIFHFNDDYQTKIDFSKILINGFSLSKTGRGIFFSQDLSDKAWSHKLSGQTNFKFVETASGIFYLEASSPISGDRFVKSLKHLAKLCGATGVKEDLF